MPDADDVLAAIRRLELQGDDESNVLGPSGETGVSGRSVSSGGPVFSPPLRDLGLLLDDTLIDDLLLVEGPRVSIPVEMALGALAGVEPDTRGPARDRRRRDVLEGAVDTLGARWRLSSWSGRDLSRAGDVAAQQGSPAPPAFLAEPSFGANQRRKAKARFSWDLPGGGRTPSERSAGEEELGASGIADPLEMTAAQDPADPSCGRAKGPQSLSGALPRGCGPVAGSGREAIPAGHPDRSGTGALSETPDRDAAAAIARAKRAPSPFTAAFASLVFPGWGQSLNDERGKAAIFRNAYLATLALAATLAWRGPLGRLAAALTSEDFEALFRGLGTAFTAGVGLWLLSVYDAFIVRSAHRR